MAKVRFVQHSGRGEQLIIPRPLGSEPLVTCWSATEGVCQRSQAYLSACLPMHPKEVAALQGKLRELFAEEISLLQEVGLIQEK